MIKIYGIPNCDTVRKAVKWLEGQNLDHEFIDYRKNPVSTKEIESWDKVIGWETFLNKRSTAWKPLEQEIKDNINKQSAIKLMQEKVTLIKRPVLVIEKETGKEVYLGFKPEIYENIFA